MYYQGFPYEAYLLDEIELSLLKKNLEIGQQKNISFLGYFINYDENSNIGVLEYKGVRFDVNFSRVAKNIQLKSNKELIMVYGFLQKKKEDVDFFCNYYRIINLLPDTEFNFDLYKKMVLIRRNIMQNAQEIKIANEFWVNNCNSMNIDNN